MKISIKDKIRTILDGDNAGAGRFFNLLIQFLILVSVASFSLETLPDLTEQHRLWLRRLEVFVVSGFFVYLNWCVTVRQCVVLSEPLQLPEKK